MHFGKLTVITGLALEAWMLVATIGAGLQFMVFALLA